MKRYLVSLSAWLSGADAEARLARLNSHFASKELQHTEYSVNDRRDDKSGDIRCELQSFAGDDAPLAVRLEALRTDFPEVFFGDPDFEFYLHIAVLHDTFTCSVELPAELASFFTSRGLSIHISTYPTDFAGDDTDSTAG